MFFIRLVVSAVAAWAAFLALLFAATLLPPQAGGVGSALAFSLPLAVFLGVELWLRRRRIL